MPPRGPPLSDHQAEVTDFYFGRSLEEMSAATAEALARSPLTFPCLHTERGVCVHKCGTVRSLAPRNKGLAGTSSATASLTFHNPIGPSCVPQPHHPGKNSLINLIAIFHVHVCKYKSYKNRFFFASYTFFFSFFKKRKYFMKNKRLY